MNEAWKQVEEYKAMAATQVSEEDVASDPDETEDPEAEEGWSDVGASIHQGQDDSTRLWESDASLFAARMDHEDREVEGMVS
jgi:hypothetical protein